MKLPEKISNLIKYNKKFIIPKFIYFDYFSYNLNKKKILDKIKKNFKEKIIIRSASYLEDNDISNAGKYISVSKVNPKNSSHVSTAIKKVFDSYKSKKNQYIIVQKMLYNTKLSGVIFNVDRQNALPFTTINYSTGKQTSLITSGHTNGRIITYLNNHQDKSKNKLIKFSAKINKVLKNKPYDIEFCLDEDNKFKIFQIRKLKTNTKTKNPKKIIQNLFFLKKKVSKLIGKNYLLTGNKTIFSTMTDWNPAEMLGIKPKPLALSLYKEIITNHIWSDSRKELGYSNVRSLPLLHDFIGTPYIDVRLDINSFFPNDLDNKIREKIYKYYFNKFQKNPYDLHDKLESKLVFNCIDFSSKDKINVSLKTVLKKNEIKKFINNLTNLTNKIFDSIDINIDKYKKINSLLEKIKKEKIHPINKIYMLVNIAKYDGALPFANLARMAFVGVSFLNSMVEKNIISNHEKESFINSIDLVTTKMLVNKNKLSKTKFLKIYGHLRPDTYDIDQKNYKEGFNYYFTNKIKLKKRNKFKFKKKQVNLIKKYLNKNNLKINFNTFFEFLKKSIYHRENSKFYYSKIINEIFEEIKIIGKKFDLNKHDLGYLKIEDILKLYNNFSDTNRIAPIFRKNIKFNKINFNLNKELNLPDIIKNENDLVCNYKNVQNFTYIGQGTVFGKIKYLLKQKDYIDINNKIICIERADPGFDFIFSKNILGLITCYGGPNSHMSIRCNELNIPAVIGCGRSTFEDIIKSNTVKIDLDTKKILKLS